EFVFFSRGRRHTRSKRDWSSDVCSSDLIFRQCLLYFHVSLPRCVVVDSSIGIKVWLEMLARVGTYKNGSTQSPFYGGSTWSFKAKAYALGLTFDGLEVVGAEGCIVKLMCTGIRLAL